MEVLKYLLFVVCVTSRLNISDGCQMEGIQSWMVPVQVSVTDVYSGVFFQRSTTNILGISSSSMGEGLVQSVAYIEPLQINDEFTLSTSNLHFPNYEEFETSQNMAVTVIFNCVGGTTSTLVFMVNIIDTNNNAPQFSPQDQFEFTIAPPLPPNFSITGCDTGITVRDIDLTTQRIEFAIEENPYFQITYEESLSTPKEFRARLSTTTYIRSFSEPLTLKISATDVDLTDDPPQTTVGTIRIQGDNSFELPDDMKFSKTFYVGNYSQSHQVALEQMISLQQGYDDKVEFSLEGDYSDNFDLDAIGNSVSLVVSQPLPLDTLRVYKQVLLIIKAERELITDITATIVLELPEEIPLLFERPHYEGSIENNILQVPNIILSQGYQDQDISLYIESEFQSFFTASIEGNTITLTMANIDQSIIDTNNNIKLEVIASTERSSAVTVVFIEIIKDDNSTPAFEKSIYTGSYDPSTGLILEEIKIVQGFDESVSVNLKGEYSHYFTVSQNGPIITLVSSQVPDYLFIEQKILISVEATKPRTVGATTVVSIALPEARELSFTASVYKGNIQDNLLTLDSIILNNGYGNDVNFTLSGDLLDYFGVTNSENQVNITLSGPIPDYTIEEYNVVALTLTASGSHAIPTATFILLEVIKNDLVTPLFTKDIYHGTYTKENLIIFDEIVLAQGYDETVAFKLEGDNSNFFNIIQTENNIELFLKTSIPDEVIFEEKVFVFNILAEKILTVGGRAAVHIKFSEDLTNLGVMTFTNNTYVGTYKNDSLSLQSIILESGYQPSTQFNLWGEHASYFSLNYENNVATISVLNALPIQFVENNEFLVLEIEASRDRAVSVSSSVIIDVIKEDIVHPEFSEAYYRGVYTEEKGLVFDEMLLARGYDETVTFELEGEFAAWFTLVKNENSLSLLSDFIPVNIVNENTYLVLTVLAEKTNARPVRSTVIIDLPKEIPEVIILSFEQKSYEGRIENGQLQLVNLNLNEDYNLIPQFNVTGDYASYFNTIESQNSVVIQLSAPIPTEILEAIEFIVLEVTVEHPEAISGHATVIIYIAKSPEPITPVFEEPFYIGEFSENDGLSFNNTIRLTHGFDETVVLTLVGDDSQWFSLVETNPNNFTLTIKETPIINGINVLAFTVVASKPETDDGKSAIVISLTEVTVPVLRFERISYIGTIENSVTSLEPIRLSENILETVTFDLFGELESYFEVNLEDNNINIELVSSIPEDILSTMKIIVLELRASAADATPAYTTIVFELIPTEITPTEFNKLYYTGFIHKTEGFSFENSIALSEGYEDTVLFDLEGDDSQWFELIQTGNNVTIFINDSLPESLFENKQQLIFIITAEKPKSQTARATIVISLVKGYIETQILSFQKKTYSGTINNTNIILETITLVEGYSENVSFTLYGEYADNFSISSNGPSVMIIFKDDLTILDQNNVIILELQASTPDFIPAHATIVLEITKEKVLEVLTFSEPYYTGKYSQDEGIALEKSISLVDGYDDSVVFELEGENSIWFRLDKIGDNSFNLNLNTAIPPAIISNNQRLIFTIKAQKTVSHIARTTVVISLTQEYKETDTLLGFEKISYTGIIDDTTSTVEPIILSEGFSSEVKFNLLGALSNYFSLSSNEATVTVYLQTPIPQEILTEHTVIVLELEATAQDSIPAHATVVFEVIKEIRDLILFDETYYYGSYNETEGLKFTKTIILVEGYNDNVSLGLEGDNAIWFTLVQNGNLGYLILDVSLPVDVVESNSQLIFIVVAENTNGISAKSTIVIAIEKEQSESKTLSFEKVSYLGILDNGVVRLDPITLTAGSDLNVTFVLKGELSEYFLVSSNSATVTVTLNDIIPEENIPQNKIIILELEATAPLSLSAFCTIVFEVITELDSVYFDKILYNGIVQGSIVQHETITLVGYTGTIKIIGVYGSIFTATLSNEIVSVTLTGSLILPPDESSIALELHASEARAVLILNIDDAETPMLPKLTFSSESYALQAHTNYIGWIGRVLAAADTGEKVIYSLDIDNGYLQQRVSIDNEGEIYLSAPTNDGTYHFKVQASTIITKVTENAEIILTVSDDTVCIEDNTGLPPLIVIHRDEEEPHRNLVTLNATEFPGCRYIMTNRWPANQTWLYVDEVGLHTTAIDREDSSIAHMPLSQIQIELILQCQGNYRFKRSNDLGEVRTDWLGPYDYGNNKWIIAEEIDFNPRRSLVNLIVNDINDNLPIFDGNHNEPLVVGYPVADLEETILPRSLAELKASDADVGENAVIMYWSSESLLAVSPTTGFVHVRSNAKLENNMRFIVHATDRFGEGLTGSKELMVKLVDSRHIAVVTVRDAFLEDEKMILDSLSASVGYEVKALRSVIINQDETSDELTKSRIKRETPNDVGTSMVVFVYGLDDAEPVLVDQLKNDINSITSAAVSVVNTVSLEDHLEGLEICNISGRDTVLLVSTIVLSILLFILTVTIGLWFFLKWWRKRKYEQFSDESSLNTENNTIDEMPQTKPINRPRLNIEDLKRSEKRLQEMLDAPIQEVSVEVEPARIETVIPSSPPLPNVQSHVVIQSIDKLKTADDESDEDEFGEREIPRRKSVVTFNENVEKIIHVEDDPDDLSDYGVYKL